MKNSCAFRLIAFLSALVMPVFSNYGSWVYTETNTVANGVSKGSITDGVWTFYAERAKGATDELTVDASKGMQIDPAAPAKIDFTDISDGWKIVKFIGVRSVSSPLVLYTTEFIGPDCTNLSGQEIFYPGPSVENTTLTKVALREDALITLGNDRMFMNCTRLASFTPRRIANKALQISMFQNCKLLDGGFELPDCTSIGQGVFSECDKIGEIIAAKVTSIGQSTFGGCASLSNIVLSSAVTKIGNYAFKGCAKISTEFVQGLLNPELQLLGNSATDRKGPFQDCTGLTGAIIWDMPSLATNAVPFDCFRGCSLLERIEIKSPVAQIDEGAFSGMKPGAEIVLPANVAPLIAKSAILQGQPYLKVILKGSHEEWLAAMKVNNYVLERDEFSDTSWTQKLDNSNESKMGTWTELTSRMRMDGSMCTEKKIGEVTYPVVQNKKVIAFVYYRNNAIPGYGCWVMKEPTIGFPIRLR